MIKVESTGHSPQTYDFATVGQAIRQYILDWMLEDIEENGDQKPVGFWVTENGKTLQFIVTPRVEVTFKIREYQSENNSFPKEGLA